MPYAYHFSVNKPIFPRDRFYTANVLWIIAFCTSFCNCLYSMSKHATSKMSEERDDNAAFTLPPLLAGVMHSYPFICLSVCRSVCNLAELLTELWVNYYIHLLFTTRVDQTTRQINNRKEKKKIWNMLKNMYYRLWIREEFVKFWEWSGTFWICSMEIVLSRSVSNRQRFERLQNFH